MWDIPKPLCFCKIITLTCCRKRRIFRESPKRAIFIAKCKLSAKLVRALRKFHAPCLLKCIEINDISYVVRLLLVLTDYMISTGSGLQATYTEKTQNDIDGLCMCGCTLNIYCMQFNLCLFIGQELRNLLVRNYGMLKTFLEKFGVHCSPENPWFNKPKSKVFLL